MRKSLKRNNWVLFDENCYRDIEDEDACGSYLRYYSQQEDRFYLELTRDLGWSSEDAMRLVDLLWYRIIMACKRFRIPLTNKAKAAEQRLIAKGELQDVELS